MTVHKSQGGTFDEIIFEYHRGLQQQLVYVALSRVKTLEGLFLTNKNRDHTFYHTRPSSNPKFKKLRSELERLEKHPFRTLDHETLKTFKGFETILPNFNVQNLAAHIEDIITDTVLMEAAILCFTETRNSGVLPPKIPKLRLLASNARPTKAGGVAIYVSDELQIVDCNSFQPEMRDDDVGDLCAALFTLNGRKFTIVTVYLNPGISLKELEQFFGKFNTALAIDPNRDRDDSPTILCGDFNVNMKNAAHKDNLLTFMRNKFHLELLNTNEESTTYGDSCIDLVFVRNIANAECLANISYFSYHKPIFMLLNQVFLQ